VRCRSTEGNCGTSIDGLRGRVSGKRPPHKVRIKLAMVSNANRRWAASQVRQFDDVASKEGREGQVVDGRKSTSHGRPPR
jgi:hypothetical protein